MMGSTILSWNCRGLSNPKTMNQVKLLLARLKVDFMCLVEITANEERIPLFCAKFSKYYY